MGADSASSHQRTDKEIIECLQKVNIVSSAVTSKATSNSNSAQLTNTNFPSLAQFSRCQSHLLFLKHFAALKLLFIATNKLASDRQRQNERQVFESKN